MHESILEAVQFICERLQDRKVTLFLGAGINFGIKNPAGDSFPLGQALSDNLCRDLLESDLNGRPLDDTAEMARHRLGAAAVNNYIRRQFDEFTPGPAHLALVQLPWNVIYTTNYDTLIEQAASNPTITPAGRIRPVFSASTCLDTYAESDVPYYKLHGCVDYANTNEGRLILTKEDYRFYETHRKPLFRRLKEDYANHTFVFIGYSLVDSNLRAIIEECREQAGATALPRSFAVRPDVSPAEAVFWQDKFNVQNLGCDGRDFLNLLKGTWHAQSFSVVPFADRDKRALFTLDPTAAFPKVGDSFYRVEPKQCTGHASPKAFFLGSPPTWADIREAVAPPRDVYIPMLGAMLEELVDISIAGNTYLITGPAGTGKTTLVRSLAYELARDSKIPVLFHIAGTPLDEKAVATVYNHSAP